MHDTITGAVFKEMLLFGAVSVTAAKQSINDLNVVPEGLCHRGHSGLSESHVHGL